MLINWILIRKREINVGCKGNHSLLPPTIRLVSDAYLGQAVSSLITEFGVLWSGLFLWAVGVSCPSCIPSQPLAHSTHWGDKLGKKCGLDALQALLSSCQNTGELPRLFNHRYKTSTIWAAVKEVNSIPLYHGMVNLKIHFVSASVS